MKKSDWTYLAKAMWQYSEKNEGKVSRLLKELIIEINKSEMIKNDMGESSETIGSNGQTETHGNGEDVFRGNGEF